MKNPAVTSKRSPRSFFLAAAVCGLWMTSAAAGFLVGCNGNQIGGSATDGGGTDDASGTGGTDDGTTVSRAGTYGTLTVTKATGAVLRA